MKRPRVHTQRLRSSRGRTAPRSSWVGGAALLVLAGGAALLVAQPEAWRSAPDLVGTARAVDGDTLRLAGNRVRLLGLDAPELAQTCQDGGGADWPCGSAAFARLRELLAGGEATCVQRGHDRYGRVLARCSVGATDVASIIVAEGLAVANGDYGTEEAAARAARKGIWAGRFERPASWREGARTSGLWDWITGLFQ